ncbi:hypothetical protein IEQ34_023038 [Dendrobium chrysotoxum]|uniref:Uncharacterized protein n=1 Tax=Dendrobium chrysotoxum TaxID=161865 RepID=A0AAV7G0N9_DENCH|nr:hypothetical protein IEQ34_023038 [Dendrobium chrysotoxum]
MISKGRNVVHAPIRARVMTNAKKFRYCGIDPEHEHRLDLMFMGWWADGLSFKYCGLVLSSTDSPDTDWEL